MKDQVISKLTKILYLMSNKKNKRNFYLSFNSINFILFKNCCMILEFIKLQDLKQI